MRQLAIPPPSPIFAVDGRLIVVCGGGSVRGCTIVTALKLAPQYRSLAAVGPIPRDHAAMEAALACRHPRYGARR